MDIIKNYLESMFSNLPQTEEILKAKRELGQMMEDKYVELITEGFSENEAIGKVISEFGNIDELKMELLPTDFQSKEKKYKKIRISSREADKYLEDVRAFSKSTKTGVFFCILSPTLLVFLNLYTEKQLISEKYANVFGLTFFFILVAVGVLFFILQGNTLAKYNEWKSTPLDLDMSTQERLNQAFKTEHNQATKKIAIGVTICIIAIAQLCLVSLSDYDSIYLPIAMVVFFLLVAISVTLFIPAGMIQDAYKVLLEKDDYAVLDNGKKVYKIKETLDGVFWPIIVCIYLFWSFITSDWHITWIIWPIAGLLFEAFCALFNFRKK